MPFTLEATALVHESMHEFIHFVSDQLVDVMDKKKRKTMGVDDVITALVDLEFKAYADALGLVREEVADARLAKETKKRKLKAKPTMSSEELAKQQAALFEQARLEEAAEEEAIARRQVSSLPPY